MEDLKNHKFYYLMWLPHVRNIIWEARNKKALPQKTLVEGINLYEMLNNVVNLAKWRKQYTALYRQWLENDDNRIFDLQHPVNAQIIHGLKNINSLLPSHIHLCYWYDVDRSLDEDFIWENSPLSGKRLIDLGEDFFEENRLWDKENNLLLPKRATDRQSPSLSELSQAATGSSALSK
ncbi:hypothetical protein [Rhodoflexus caldus]|uniref:hypothetical protein n=1 Tax=Rhodoflexus caldus TaxID=2891236 RepID=UPI00202A008F|nr:hypothetical protein [Rhodoflexus caldus]